jgi:hypothetical protein
MVAAPSKDFAQWAALKSTNIHPGGEMGDDHCVQAMPLT